MSILWVVGSEDFNTFSAPLFPVVSEIVFDSESLISSATFGSWQFGTLISNTVQIDGTWSNSMIVQMGAPGLFSAAGWTFRDWGSPWYSDTVTLEGTGGADTIVGAVVGTIFDGMGGADTLFGGPNNDEFVLVSPATLAGTRIDGGDGLNTIHLVHNDAIDPGVVFNLSSINLTKVQALEFDASGLTAILAGDQVGAGAITHVAALPAAHDSLIVRGAHIDLAAVVFNEVDSVTLIGTSAYGNALFGSNHDDLIIGHKGPDKLMGRAGDDTVNGGDGNDALDGGPGNDVLSGSTGKDAFLFTAALNAATNVDRITDFTHHTDMIELSHAVFTRIAPGMLSAAEFHAGLSATHASDRIIYDHASGSLWYDPDGNGPHAQTLFAVLTNHATLSPTDLMVA